MLNRKLNVIGFRCPCCGQFRGSVYDGETCSCGNRQFNPVYGE